MGLAVQNSCNLAIVAPTGLTDLSNPESAYHTTAVLEEEEMTRELEPMTLDGPPVSPQTCSSVPAAFCKILGISSFCTAGATNLWSCQDH